MAKARKSGGPLVAIAGVRYPDLHLEEKILGPLRCRIERGPADTPESTIALCREAEAVLIGSIPNFTAGVIGELVACRILSRAGIGVDNIDLVAAKEKNIPVTNVPDYCIGEVSDHAMALILSFARKLPEGTGVVAGGGWGIVPLRPIRPLAEATLGIVGIGRIGSAIGKKARAFGMRILAHDPFAPEAAFKRIRAEKTGMARLLRASDYITLHAPLIPKTRGMIGAEALSKMKPEAVLINVARGELIDEPALHRALRAGQIRGAGLDVLCEEPPSGKHPLIGVPGCLITPHSAWYSTAAQEELRRKSAEEVLRVLSRKKPRNRVA
ncbi:MAG: C-terminal binding protein [Nitrospinota bacterium]